MAPTKQTARASIYTTATRHSGTEQTASDLWSSGEDEDDEIEESEEDEGDGEGSIGVSRTEDSANEHGKDASVSSINSHRSHSHEHEGQNETELLPDNTIAADSGYQSGRRTDCDTSGGNDAMDDDACSVATDGQHSSLPPEHKQVLEAQFARELLDRIEAPIRDRCITHLETLTNLLKMFSILIRCRATSRKERDAASFVRHRREYVQSMELPV